MQRQYCKFATPTKMGFFWGLVCGRAHPSKGS